MRSASNRLVSRDEELSIRLLLLSPEEHYRKLGLMQICELLQSRRFFRDNAIHHDVRGFVFDRSVEVERWALKALAEFKDPNDADLILSRITNPHSDDENFSWAVAAFFAAAREGQIDSAIQRRLIPINGLTLLASSFTRLRHDRFKAITINIENATALELKWACLCFGMGRVSGAVFDPRFDQLDQLSMLNVHDDEEVAQYSVYAMVRMREATFRNLQIPMQDIAGKPEGVRKWSYRLFAQHQDNVRTEIDFFQDAARYDEGVRAQEGLAIGIYDIWIDGIETITVDWLSRGIDERVVRALLAHMARNAEQSDAYQEVVRSRFAQFPRDGLQRSQILAAASGKPIYADLHRIAATESGIADLFQFDRGALIVTNNIKIEGDGNVIGAVAAGGDATATNVKQKIVENGDQMLMIQELVEAAKKDRSREAQLVAQEGDRFLRVQDRESAASLLGALKDWKEAVAISANAASILGFLAMLAGL